MTDRVIEKLIQRQINQWNRWDELLSAGTDPAALRPRPTITVSRQLGSGGRALAEALALRLDLQLHGYDIVEHIARDQHLEEEVVAGLDEQVVSQIRLWITGVLNRRIFLKDEYHVALVRVVRTLAVRGGVVILGRGGNFILAERADLRLRLVAGDEYRVQNLARRDHLGEAEARARILESDASRRLFVEKLFHTDVDDPRHYDLVLNAERLRAERLPELAIEALQAREEREEKEAFTARAAAAGGSGSDAPGTEAPRA